MFNPIYIDFMYLSEEGNRIVARHIVDDILKGDYIAKSQMTINSYKFPNILLIILDTVRADHLSCYGYFRKTSPCIDEIAQESTLFERCFSVAPWTPPSIASMLTGLFPSEHGVEGDNLYLDEKLPYLPKLLSDQGYKTVAFSNTPHISRKRGFHNGFDDFVEVYTTRYPKILDFVRIKMQDMFMGRDSGARKINSLAIEWLKHNQGQKSPFFMFINYLEAHHPYRPPSPYRNKFLKEYKRVNLKKIRKVARNIWLYLTKKVDISDDEFEALAAIYDEEILYMDAMLGQLLDYLRKQKLFDDTLIIITSDHGENFGEHRLVSHNLCLYNTVLHVPLVVRWPHHFPLGKRVKTLVQTTDLYPTILQIIQVEDEERKNPYTSSLLNSLTEENNARYIYAQYKSYSGLLKSIKKQHPEFDYSAYNKDFWMVSDGEYKYILDSTGHHEFYDMISDFYEKQDISGFNPVVKETLAKILGNWRRSLQYFSSKRKPNDDKLIKSRLKALGYL